MAGSPDQPLGPGLRGLVVGGQAPGLPGHPNWRRWGRVAYHWSRLRRRPAAWRRCRRPVPALEKRATDLRAFATPHDAHHPVDVWGPALAEFGRPHCSPPDCPGGTTLALAAENFAVDAGLGCARSHAPPRDQPACGG